MKHEAVLGWTWAVAAVLAAPCGRAVAKSPPGVPSAAPRASTEKGKDPHLNGTGWLQEISRASAEKRKDPHQLTSWLSMGADLRLRTIRERARKLQNGDHDHDRYWQRWRGRVWGKIEPAENLELNFRLVTEPRLYCRRDLPHPLIREEALFDRANVKKGDAKKGTEH